MPPLSMMAPLSPTCAVYKTCTGQAAYIDAYLRLLPLVRKLVVTYCGALCDDICMAGAGAVLNA